MADIGRGLPLLSGPPPVLETTGPDACRKCNKEFNILFTRSRKCNHCGYSYCHSCTDFTALMPRTGNETGYDSVNVCGYCIEYLQITAAGRNHLKSMSLAKLKNYLAAYDIKTTRVVEKDDLIDAILAARQPDGCLPRANENYYRTHSVPAKSTSRPRGLFSSRSGQPPPRVPPRPSANTQQQPEFARPDLEPDHPPTSSPQTQPRNNNAYPPQQQQRPQQQQQYRPPPQQYTQQNHYNTPPPPPPRPHSAYPTPSNGGNVSPPHFYTPPPPSQNVPYTPYHGYGYPQHQQQQPQQHHPYPQYQPRQQQNRPAPPPRETRPMPFPQAAPSHAPTPATAAPPPPPTQPRPRAASATPPPSLDQLLNMTHDAIRGLSISALKEILFTNHVNAGQILEKSDLVQKVWTLVDAERKERERQRQAEEREEMERVQRLEEARKQRERAEHGDDAATADSADGEAATTPDADTDGTGSKTPPVSSSPPKSTPAPPPTKGNLSSLERTGLCVICQDEEANIAIVDCGHMAMCRECSDLIMASSRECPLCRTRIITEQRLLRIYKT